MGLRVANTRNGSGKLWVSVPTVTLVPFAKFMLFSAITRGVRYNLVAGLFYFFGPSIQAVLEKYMALAMTAFLALVVLGFVAVRYIF